MPRRSRERTPSRRTRPSPRRSTPVCSAWAWPAWSRAARAWSPPASRRLPSRGRTSSPLGHRYCPRGGTSREARRRACRGSRRRSPRSWSATPLRAFWRTPKTGCHTPGVPFRSRSGRNRTSRRFLPTRTTRVWRISRARCRNSPSASARRRSAQTLPGSVGGGLTAARARTACGNGPSRSRAFPTG